MPKRDEYFDTYESMTQEEKDELILIQKIKTNIKNFVGIDNIIEELTKLIDESKYISFSSERNKKYISKTKPLFILKLNKKSIKQKLLFLESKDDDYFIDGHTNPKYVDDINYIQNLVYEEVIKHYSSWLMEFLTDNEKFLKILNENGLKEITIDANALRLITMTSAVMFAIKVDLKNEKIYVEYAI